MTNELTNATSIAPADDILTHHLDGFEFVESDGLPTITLDNQSRLYINATARRLMGVKPYQRLAVAYNASTKTLAIVKPYANMSAEQTAAIATSNYNVDKRYYMSARHFAKKYAFDPSGAPHAFVYERAISDGVAFTFKLRD